jgi:hypothetical protein
VIVEPTTNSHSPPPSTLDTLTSRKSYLDQPYTDMTDPQSLTDPWASIKAVLDDNNHITPISPRPTVPAECPGTVLGYLNRAYAYGDSAHASQNLQLEPVFL